MGPNSQPMVEVPHRHPLDNEEGRRSLEQAKETISSASLGRIGVANLGQEGHRFQRDGGGAYKELPNT